MGLWTVLATAVALATQGQVPPTRLAVGYVGLDGGCTCSSVSGSKTGSLDDVVAKVSTKEIEIKIESLSSHPHPHVHSSHS